MAVKKEPCKYHPQRLTSRRCYFCKAPICHECQHHFEHHLFCGRWCYYRWKIGQIQKRFGRLPHKEFYLSLFLLLIVAGSLFLYFNHRLDLLARQQKIQTQRNVSDSLWFDLDTTISQATGRVSFRLKAPRHVAITLWHNGVPLAMPSNGTFADLPLSFGENRFVLWEFCPDGRAVLIDSFTIGFRSARLRFMARPLYRVDLQAKYLALTFDGGSTDRGTQNILDILKAKDVHCTMFLTGRFMQHYPQLTRRILSDGHQVGSHTFNHPHLTSYALNGRQETLPRVNRRFLFKQLRATDSLFVHLTGRHLAPFWRAPYGEFNAQILRWAAEAGFKHVGWSEHCDALDWVADSSAKLYRSGARILRHFLHLEETSGLQGRIILMHLGTDRPNDYPYQILPALIDSLRKRGYRFVTVGQLMALKTSEREERKYFP